MTRRSIFWGLVAVIGGVPAAAVAHHSAAPYDLTKSLGVAGTVSTFRYTNPHIMIVVETPGGRWDIEGGSPNQLSRRGWTRDAVKVGDKVEITAHPLRVGGNGGFLATIKLPDGHVLEN